MAAGRTLKSLISRRRRTEEEEEDEDGPVMPEDSESEASVVTEPADDDEGDGSDVGEPSAAGGDSRVSIQEKSEAVANGTRRKKARKSKKKASKQSQEATSVSQAQPETSFNAMADTDAMMNGLKISNQDRGQEEAIDFENMEQNSTTVDAPVLPNGHTIAPAERQRREHEEYKKKRDSDPAFIPNRGNFFMHDTRGQLNGQIPPPRGAWQNRGRGRPGANVGGPFSPANQMAQAERAAQQPWKHDLHEVINEDFLPQKQNGAPIKAADTAQDQIDPTRLAPKVAPSRNQGQHRVLSFDTATLVGKAKVRVLLPGMKAPIVFSDVPINAYIRLPDHRPPLRRDKPVRVFVPGHIQRYIFPLTDRSFIFIPRQMRPNQQGFHRGHYQRSIGGYGYSSRRTSMYGGSVYSPSVAQSRRSSLAGISRDNAFSPVGSTLVGMPSNRPVVRLPHSAQHFSAASTPVGPLSGQHTPTNIPHLHTYPLPQQPQFQGTPTTTVHQPRPQKAISVNDIESPAILQQTPSEPQPFQNQLPAHMNEPQPYQQQPQAPYFSPRQQYQYIPPQPQIGTPLSGIPEQAMQAPSFQPQPYGQPPYYPQYPPHQGFYYSSAPNGYPQMPMYMMPPPPGYMMPPQPPPMPTQPVQPQQARPSSSGDQEQQQPPSGMVAHESNGMVFYVPASEAQQTEQYQPAESFVPSYAMPGLPPPTPAPDDPMTYYYPQMPHSGMQEVGTAVYYPTQQ